MGKFIMVVLLALAVSGFFVGSASAIVYNFESGMGDWESVSGDWAAEDGELVQTNTAIPAMRALVGEESWEDYTIECRIKIDSGSYTGVVFRAMSDLEYYVFYMNANENVVEVWRHTGPGDTDRLQEFKHAPLGGITIVQGDWYDFKIVVEGTTGQFYVNDELQDEIAALVYDAGRVGAWAWNTGASFDDFSISGPDIPELSVDPKAKMALTWGEMKAR